ncbi:MAG: class I SAM-dependent methyltransferase [Chloroflexota bacterium]|nr:class I SAM-dependent methyltransferase [Chloroflexota bacterium]
MKSIGQHFDEWAPSYDAEIRDMVPRYEEIHDTLTSLLSLRPPKRVLDLGAGTGYTLLRVLDALPETRVTGLDVSGEMLSRAAQRLAGHEDRVELRQSDIVEPAIEGTYDAILSVLAVHHLWSDQKRHLFGRIWEHVSPGGLFVVADYFRHASALLLELYQLPAADAHEAAHDHPDTTAEHLTWLTAAGFDAVDVVWKYEDVGVLVAWKANR